MHAYALFHYRNDNNCECVYSLWYRHCADIITPTQSSSPPSFPSFSPIFYINILSYKNSTIFLILAFFSFLTLFYYFPTQVKCIHLHNSKTITLILSISSIQLIHILQSEPYLSYETIGYLIITINNSFINVKTLLVQSLLLSQCLLQTVRVAWHSVRTILKTGLVQAWTQMVHRSVNHPYLAAEIWLYLHLHPVDI